MRRRPRLLRPLPWPASIGVATSTRRSATCSRVGMSRVTGGSGLRACCPEEIPPAQRFAVSHWGNLRPCADPQPRPMSRRSALPGVAGTHTRTRVCILRRALALVGHATSTPSGKASGTTSAAVAHAAHAPCWPQTRMPGARWFPGAQVNYAQQVLRHVDAGARGRHAGHRQRQRDSGRGARDCRWPELRRQVASLALHLHAQGVQPGDRVAAYLPNVPETMVAFLAVRQHRRGLERLRARHGHARRARPLPPDRAQGADRRRRRALRRQARIDRSAVVARAARRAAERATPAAAATTWAPRSAIAGRRRRLGRDAIARDDAADRGLRARMAAVRPSDLDRLFQRHHRPAQAHRARPRRHRDRGAWRLRPAQRHRRSYDRQQLRRALPLVQLDRLGDVELRRSRGLAARRHHLHLRRQPGAAARTRSPTGRVLWRFVADSTASPSSAPARPSSPTA